MKASRRIKPKTGPWTYIIIASLLFTVGAIASYFYFKPKLALEIPFIENIEPQKLETKIPEKEPKTEDSILSIEIEKEPVNSTLLVTIENMIKKYLKPYDAKLLEIYIDKEKTVYIDLSSELKKNFQGDAIEEQGFIAGLYKSIKEKIPDAVDIKILIEGKEADSFGGHIDLSVPIGEKIIGG